MCLDRYTTAAHAENGKHIFFDLIAQELNRGDTIDLCNFVAQQKAQQIHTVCCAIQENPASLRAQTPALPHRWQDTGVAHASTQQIADGMVCQEFAQRAQGRITAPLVVEAEHAPAIECGVGDTFGFLDSQSQWRFAQDMLARSQRGQDGLGVVARVVTNVNTVDGRLA
jgi:hypothetical protein